MEDIDRHMNAKAVQFFRTLIPAKQSVGKSTRPANFAGHIGRHMDKPLKNWFLTRYEKISDYVKFFLETEHQNHFRYDSITGEVYLKTSDQLFVKPERLTALETECCDPGITLELLSANVSELELFLVIFKYLSDGYELNKWVEMPVQRLVDLLEFQKYDRLFQVLSSIGANRKQSQSKFASDLMSYLPQNYYSIFGFNVKMKNISLKRSVVEDQRRVSTVISDSVYNIFIALLAKYLETKGSKDVEVLEKAMTYRHPIVVFHTFGSKGGQEFTFIDLCLSEKNVFTFEKSVDSNGQVLRLIGLQSVKKVVEKTSVTEVKTIEEENDSEDEIYISEEECEDKSELKADSDLINGCIQSLNSSTPFPLNRFNGNNDPNSSKPSASDCIGVPKTKSADKKWTLNQFKAFAKQHKYCVFKKLMDNKNIGLRSRDVRDAEVQTPFWLFPSAFRDSGDSY